MPIKNTKHLLSLIVVALSSQLFAQGTFVYDQQSSDESYFGSGARGIQSNQPLGQSFTPSLSAIDFIRIHLGDSVDDGLGAMIRINLRTNSISGAVLASTLPVSLASQHIGSVNFFFQSTVGLSSGVTYYFQPEVIAGGAFSASVYNTFGYTGGDAYSQGLPVLGWDLWFREGIVVPEPSAAVLVLAGLAMTRVIRKSRK